VASAFLPFDVAIRDRQGAVAVGLTQISRAPLIFADSGPAQRSFAEPFSGSNILQDGQYTVRGVTMAGAVIVNASPSRSGLAIADMFFNRGGLNFDVSASPITGFQAVAPEPATLLLLGSGLTGLPLMRRIMKHNDTSSRRRRV
jgi:hypothetical protein